ncbi:hypothetical protein ACHAXT_013023 [Thalassiosira profunda]
MVVQRRKNKPAGKAALCAALLATSASALNLWGGEKVAESDADPASAPANPHLHQQPSDPLPGQDVNGFGQPTYGVDVSFPIHHREISDNYAWLPHNVDPENNPTPPEYEGKPVQYLGRKQEEYDAFMDGCDAHYGGKRGRYSACRATEEDRVEMSLRQPKSMQNYTELGFKKIKAPKEVWERVKKFWDDNKDRENWKSENWPKGNTYTNHWESPTYMVSVEDTKLRGAGSNIKRKVWNAARDTIQEWTGEELTDCSLYGIRVYTEGSILATHVDRMPLVSSAILNVDQDVDEPWPIEVYAHDGKAYNITMEPGDMVLYESHSVLHGRPFPLKGRYYANIFIHFEPTGHSLRHEAKEAAAQAAGGGQDTHAHGGHEVESDGLPSYIVRGSVEEERWHRSHPNRKGQKAPQRREKDTFTTGSTPAHHAAQEGDAETLGNVIEKMGHLLNAKDANGWTPLHEGARGGHHEVVKILVERGANINERTMSGKGETALYTSIQQHGEDHPVSQLLMELGALNIGPDLQAAVAAAIYAALFSASVDAKPRFWKGSDNDATSAATDAQAAPQRGQEVNAYGQPTYGVDSSFPVHHDRISDNYAWLPHNVDPENNPTPPQYEGKPVQYLGNKQWEYEEYLRGCGAYYKDRGGIKSCLTTDRDRIRMALSQPSCLNNYTELGFEKVRAPDDMWQSVQQFWDDNQDKETWKEEIWPKGTTYVNPWMATSYMVAVEDPEMKGAGEELTQKIYDACKEALEEWSGETLREYNLYGIRVYTDNAVLATHVDRMPSVIGIILNVAQDVDEPWPLEVYAHDGKAYNITMEPGDMIMYEGHSLLHGRPFPLKGRHYANIFINFEPIFKEDPHDGLPAYIRRGSTEANRWLRNPRPDPNRRRGDPIVTKEKHPNMVGGKTTKERESKRDMQKHSFDNGSTPAHHVAIDGEAELLGKVLDKMGELVHAKDNRGWTPLHEGAKAGHHDVVKVLVERGANINERTMHGAGETALYWSIKENGEDHPVSRFLQGLGALSIGPDL